MRDPTVRDEAPEQGDPAADDLGYEVLPDVAEEPGADDESAGVPPRPIALKLAVLAIAVLVVAAALLAYRAHHRRTVVAASLSKADALIRLDTAAAYRQAASLLEPIAQLDPIQGGSARAFALAMLLADHGHAGGDAQIEELLVAPGRTEQVPAYAQLAAAAVALGRKEAGNATAALSRAGSGPWTLALQARVALLAGNAQAALEPAAAAAAESAFPAGLAVHGDALRRLRTDPAAGRAAYEAALAASPLHPRAAYGLAKLALAGGAPAGEAERALRRVLDDRVGTPAPERARAALHLASLRLRAGDRAGAEAALGAVELSAADRAWAERAAAVAAERRGTYRAVSGAPPALRSACDDDPGELSPQPSPPAPAPRTAPPTAHTKAAPTKKAIAAKRSSSATASKGPAAKASSAKAPRKATAAKGSPKATGTSKSNGRTRTTAKKAPAKRTTPIPTTRR